ncbi:hypothetical protein FACS1894159_00310 [Bacteroidia bacterium]|nr:hypothetical protein FACS1894159_00310 [Bacteroidia bacterium]
MKSKSLAISSHRNPVRRIAGALILAPFFALLLAGCSGSGDHGPTPVDPTDNTKLPCSVKIVKPTQSMPSLGTITSEFSDSPDTCRVDLAVDGSVYTKFATSYIRFFLRWEGSRSVVVSQYSIVSSDSDQANAPRSWTLLGSTDARTWVQLDQQQNIVFDAALEQKDFNVAANTAFKFFRLDFTENNGGPATEIAEWVLSEYVEPPLDPLLPYSFVYPNASHNMPSTGIITSQYSDFTDKSDISRIVDAYLSSKYVTFHNEFYIHWEGDDAAKVNLYSLSSSTDVTCSPRAWTLSGSNDNQTWTTVDTRTDQSFTGKETKSYELENTTAYKYYRLNITANNGGASTEISEFAMEEVPDTADDIIEKWADSYTSREGGKRTGKEIYPMGGKLAGCKVATPSDLQWLNDPSTQPIIAAEAGIKWAPYAVNLYPFGDPIPSDVIQHSIGNCALIASFASLAYQAPGYIKSIITNNGNGTFTVMLYTAQGDRRIPVSVNSTFISSTGSNLISIYGRSGATWGSVLEKAVEKWNSVYNVWGPVLSGIGSEHVMSLFTGSGHSFAFPRNALTNSELRRLVKVCLHDGYFVVGGFGQAGLPVDGASTISAHVYTMMHSTDKSALFTMRNPHGGRPRDGVLNIPDESVVPRQIDVRVIGRGKIPGTGNRSPWIPPAYN